MLKMEFYVIFSKRGVEMLSHAVITMPAVLILAKKLNTQMIHEYILIAK